MNPCAPTATPRPAVSWGEHMGAWRNRILESLFLACLLCLACSSTTESHTRIVELGADAGALGSGGGAGSDAGLPDSASPDHQAQPPDARPPDSCDLACEAECRRQVPELASRTDWPVACWWGGADERPGCEGRPGTCYCGCMTAESTGCGALPMDRMHSELCASP